MDTICVASKRTTFAAVFNVIVLFQVALNLDLAGVEAFVKERLGKEVGWHCRAPRSSTVALLRSHRLKGQTD